MKDPRRDSDRLRNLLDRATPHDDSAASRADSVRARAAHERRRNGFVGSVVIALVALTVIVVPHFISSSPVSNGDAGPANGTHQSDTLQPAALDPYDDPCPSDPVQVTDDSLGDTMTGGSAIPLSADARLIRICSAAYPGFGTSFWAPPIDALTAGLPDFFAQVGVVAPWKPMACPAVSFPVNPLALVIDYGEGKRETFALKDPYCRGVLFDGQIYNLGVILAAYSDALDGQRSESTPQAFGSGGLSCAHPDERPSLIDPGRHLDLTAARICQVPDASRPIESQQAVTKLAVPGLVAGINADFANGATVHGLPDQQCNDDPTGAATYIVGVSAWGDPRFVSDQDQCEFRFVHGFYPPGGSLRLLWTPAVVTLVTMQRGLR
jgi:hypothetical protein